jgi:hypothetical protein
LLLPMVKGGLIGILFKLGASKSAGDEDGDGARWR